MRDKFPEKEAGDTLSVSRDWNPLVRHANRFDKMVPGSFLGMHNGSSTVSLFGSSGLIQIPVIVIKRNIGSGDTDDSGYYKVCPRFFQRSTAEWINLNRQYIMDERVLGKPGGFLVGDYVICTWLVDAGVFIPCFAPDILRPCVLEGALISGGSAAANMLVGEDRDETGLSFTIYDKPTMITAAKQIPNSTTVWAIWDRVQGKWVLGIPSECEEDQP